VSVSGFWWTGQPHDQTTHEQINARHYPGTRQLCTRCDQPTGRCEDDSIYLDGWEGPVCEDCAEAARDAASQPGTPEGVNKNPVPQPNREG
jgi:hypothetical protein